MKQENVADEFAEQAPCKERVAEDSPTTQGQGFGITPEVSHLEYEGQGSYPYDGQSPQHGFHRANSLNSLDFTQYETETQDVRSHDRSSEARNSREVTSNNEPFEGSEETENGEESTDKSLHSIREPDPYSWEDWLQSTHAIDDGSAIISREDGYSIIRPLKAYGTDLDIAGALCIMCRWMLNNLRLVFDDFDRSDPWRQESMTVKHWASISDEKHAANSGCGLCKMILSRYDPSKREEKISAFESLPLTTELSFSEITGLSLYVCCGALFEPERWVSISMLSPHSMGIAKPQVEVCSSSENRLSDHEIIDLATQWLSDCDKRHTLCRPASWNPKLPSRLLEIKPESIRLRNTLGIPNQTKYATLSHCWGPNGVNFKLTKDSLIDFRTRIRHESLPKTFQDAIFVTRRLALEYLWIDSLCIIQDDPEDWRIESVGMSDVYGNFYINIAASSANDSSEGFLSGHVGSERLQVTARACKNEQECFQTLEVIPEGMVNQAISRSVLSRRGWVLQERLLSRRTLYFTDTQLFWECDALLACESFVGGVPNIERVADDHISKGNLSNEWANILFKYTSCELTQRRDMLVALSGIIKKMENLMQDTCVAGIWKSDVECQLLWYRSAGKVREAQKNLYSP